MSQSKSAVSALQELCSKRKVNPPVYEFISDDEDGGFICKVEVMGLEEIAQGRSKRDAKHLAAYNALKRLCTGPNDEINLSSVEISEVEDVIAIHSAGGKTMPDLPPVDCVNLLRNYCVQNDHPLPVFELASQYGTPSAPRFTMLCQVASIKRFRTADSKKTAKQLAAFQMFLVLKDPVATITDAMEIVSFKTKAETVTDERVHLFKSYRELIESNEKPEEFGTPLFERHNTLKKFPTHLKEAAFRILDESYESVKVQVFDLLEALKFHPKVDKVPSTKGECLVYMELDCPGLDIAFCGFEEEIYPKIIQYFRIMLV